MATQPTPPRGIRSASKLVWTAVGGVLIAAFVALIARPPERPAPPLPSEISVGEAAAAREAGSFLLDVRRQDEWESGHIPGSTLIPLDQLENRVGEVPRDREIVVVCRTGNRSKRGRDILLRAGFTRVTSMAGGVTVWNAEGRPTDIGP